MSCRTNSQTATSTLQYQLSANRCRCWWASKSSPVDNFSSACPLPWVACLALVVGASARLHGRHPSGSRTLIATMFPPPPHSENSGSGSSSKEKSRAGTSSMFPSSTRSRRGRRGRRGGGTHVGPPGLPAEDAGLKRERGRGRGRGRAFSYPSCAGRQRQPGLDPAGRLAEPGRLAPGHRAYCRGLGCHDRVPRVLSFSHRPCPKVGADGVWWFLVIFNKGGSPRLKVKGPVWSSTSTRWG